MYAYCSLTFGLPHSSNSPTVRGSDSSSIVLMTSTKGTRAMTAWKRSGRMFVTAPMRSPPAEPPSMTNSSFDVYLSAISASATAMKSVNVFFFDIIRPWSCHFLPRSPPPRMWPTA